jgi:hypothetical protein
MVLLGGVAPFQVAQATLILAATALAAGSVGTLVALWRDKTFQSLALTVLYLVLYLCVVRGLPIVVGWLPTAESSRWETLAHDAQACLDPFVALQSVLGASNEEAGTFPAAYGYAAAMLMLTVVLNVWGTMRLRVWNPSGEPIMQRERPEDEDIDRAKAHAAPGMARQIWANPILWREICTRAYGRRPLLVKLAYAVVLGLVCYYALAPLLGSHQDSSASGGLLPVAALGLVPVTVLSLLLVSAQAVTAITSERDTGALDLLLVTDLSPDEFIFGKLLGIIYNTKEFLLPPLILAGVYAWLRLLGTPPALHPEFRDYKNMESLVCVIGAIVTFLAFATMLGVHVALRTENSRLAAINTLATMFFLSVGTMVCIFLIVINTRFEYQWTSFLLFIAAGIGGFWWVLSGDRPSPALTLASCLCPLGIFYSITFILVGKPGSQESADPMMPFLVTVGAFAFTLAAMLVPLLSEFDVALGRTTGGGE